MKTTFIPTTFIPTAGGYKDKPNFLFLVKISHFLPKLVSYIILAGPVKQIAMLNCEVLS